MSPSRIKSLVLILALALAGLVAFGGRLARPVFAATEPALCSANNDVTDCPTAIAAIGELSKTHYEQVVSTSATYQILGAAAAKLGSAGCESSHVAVEIQSTPLGNSFDCGTLSGTIITFVHFAPANGCQTTQVAYASTSDPSGFNTGVTNDIIADGTEVTPVWWRSGRGFESF